MTACASARLLPAAVFALVLPTVVCGLLFMTGPANAAPTPAPKLRPGDVAVVGGIHVTNAMFAAALAEERANLKQQGQSVPPAGSPGYARLKTNVIDLLVEQTELDLAARARGITVSPAEVRAAVAKLKQTQFGGSNKAYVAGIKEQGFTDQMVHGFLRENLVETKLYAQVTRGASATRAEIAAYYRANLPQYRTPATRAVRELLVQNNQALANRIYTELQAGASFAVLAKEYSNDPGSADKGGRFTATQGNDVPEFDAAVFSAAARTGVLLKPVKTKQYGWFVIEPIAAIRPATLKTLAQASPSIQKELVTQKKQQLAAGWVKGIARTYCSGGNISYGAGYAPTPDPCAKLSPP